MRSGLFCADGQPRDRAVLDSPQIFAHVGHHQKITSGFETIGLTLAPPQFLQRGGDDDDSTVLSIGRPPQNQNFAASCTTRGSSAVVIVPKLAGPSCAAGAPKFTVFSRLNTSRRSSIARSAPKPTRRITARSTSWYDGPRTGLREADPMVN